jgi:glycerophosphoryl diester phosphodiesterase
MQPLIIAHRGASACAPENTLAAFNLAFEMGADGIELDVTLTKDRIPIVIHDDTVDRTTDGRGAVKEMTLDQTKRLDASNKFKKYRGEKIPTLAEVLEAVGERGIVNIELKTDALRPWNPHVAAMPLLGRIRILFTMYSRLVQNDGLEARVADVIEQTHSADRVLISCFNPLSLRRMYSINPRLPRGMLYANFLPTLFARPWLRRIARPHALHPNFAAITPEFVAWAHDRNYKINTWTVDAPEELRRLAALGVDGIITNKPDVMVKVVSESA